MPNAYKPGTCRKCGAPHAGRSDYGNRRHGLCPSCRLQSRVRVCRTCEQEFTGAGTCTRCLTCRKSDVRSCRHCGAPTLNGGRYECRDCEVERSAAKRHHITFERYQQMRRDQDDRCLICQEPETRRSQGGPVWLLGLDHDHRCCPGPVSCGACVRGLLCDGCNRGIGFLRENPESLRRALQYLSGELVPIVERRRESPA